MSVNDLLYDGFFLHRNGSHATGELIPEWISDMDVKIDRLLRRARSLGNHHRKYIYYIENHIDSLLTRLEQAMVIEQVHLWVSALDYKSEMKTIALVGTTLEEKLSDLSCYFSLQFLQMNLSALDALMLEMTTHGNRFSFYKEFMLRVGHDFRKLTAAYMEELICLFLPPGESPEYVFLGVGTRSDQDDIDIGVLDRGTELRELLNDAIGRMSGEMFKKAISLHFHLSEHVGSPTSYSASIKEYCDLLEKEIHDFVIITEMLGAARIIGSRRLFSEFRRQVTFRYYYSNDNQLLKFHEGYLRGIVGETRSLMLRDLAKDRLNPKGDGLRMIKNGLFAAKTIFHLRQVNAWAMIEALKNQDKRRRLYYEQLEAPLTFLEVFRYMYQLLIAQEEEIYLEEPYTFENLSAVAEAMGYRPIGAAKATDFLLTDYYKHVNQAKETVQMLLPSIVGHLSRITTFGKILHHKKVTEQGEKRLGNLAIRFFKKTRFFKGTRFWDDVISVLEQKNGRVLQRVVHNICILPPPKQEEVLDQLIDWQWNSFIATFNFLILLHRHRSDFPDPEIFNRVNVRFFDRMRGTEEEALRLSTVFKHYPVLIQNYIMLLDENQQRQFYAWLNNTFWDRELLPAKNRLQYFLKLHFGTSKYFKRIMKNVLRVYPEYLDYIDDSQQLILIGKGRLAEVERAQNLQQKLKRLRTYQQFEFFRTCLDALSDCPPQTVAMEFTEFSDTYLRLLFDTCKQEVDEIRGLAIKTKDLLGVFVTGGHGHMLAFDDDYDLIILLNSDDETIRKYSSQIISRMHKEIVKCGIMPHYRLADYTSSYVCTFNELKSILDNTRNDRFVDLSQLLGARMIIGSTILLQSFDQTFLDPYVYQNDHYVQDMIQELQGRHESEQSFLEGHGINIKESKGGLRDVELFLLACRGVFHLREHSNYKLLLQLVSRVPSHASVFQRLYTHYEYLRKIRNLNRLILAAEDQIPPDLLEDLRTNLIKKSTSHDQDNSVADRLYQTLSEVSVDIRTLLDQVVRPRLHRNSSS